MTAGGDAPGRSNGLPGTLWVHVRDVDPRLVAPLLDALRARAVPAYVTPSAGTAGAQLERRVPVQPRERLYVDGASRAVADEVLATVLPDLESTLDADDARRASEAEAFARLVESFNQPPSGGVGPWSVTEDVDPEGRRVERFDAATEAARAAATAGQPPDGPGLDDTGDHFVPPPPPPLPSPSPATKYALVAVFGGLGVLMLPTLFGDPPSGGLALLAVAAVVGGLLSLVIRMGDRPPTDSGPDDGAVV